MVPVTPPTAPFRPPHYMPTGPDLEIHLAYDPHAHKFHYLYCLCIPPLIEYKHTGGSQNALSLLVLMIREGSGQQLGGLIGETSFTFVPLQDIRDVLPRHDRLSWTGHDPQNARGLAMHDRSSLGRPPLDMPINTIQPKCHGGQVDDRQLLGRRMDMIYLGIRRFKSFDRVKWRFAFLWLKRHALSHKGRVGKFARGCYLYFKCLYVYHEWSDRRKMDDQVDAEMRRRLSLQLFAQCKDSY
jgi:hypothetical protein